MFHRAVRWALGVMRALLRALLPSLLPAMAQDDPSFDRISELYPLLGWSREGLGVADHSAAAALDRSPTVITSAAHSGQLCSVVYPLHPPVCSATKGKCTTEPSDVGSAYFVLTLRGGGDGLGEDAALAPERIVLNCSHSSTRTLKGFAPIVQVQSTAAAFQPAAQALTHRNDTDSCAPLGNVSGQRWVEYGNVCAGFYCNLGPPTTTKFCQRPDICSGCPNTPQCASNCSGDGQLSAASCDCAAAGKFCKLLRRGQTDTGARDICRRALPPSVGLGPLAAQLEFNQTLFAATEGMDSKKPLGVFLGLTIRRRASASVGLIAVAVELTGDGAEPLELATAEVGADTITVHAAVRVAGGTQAPFVNISAADFAGNLSAAEAYWKTKIEPAKGPTVPEPRVMTAWKAWLANSLIHVRRDEAGLLYPQDGVLFYEAVYGYSAALFCSMLSRFGLAHHAKAYLNSLLRMVAPDGLFTLNFGLPDHGALLVAISDFYLITRDDDWFSEAAPTVEKMVAWVIDTRQATLANQTQGSKTHGLIFYRPYCDHADPEYSYLSDTYLVLGLEAAARALTSANKSSADRVWQAAASYRRDVERSMVNSVYTARGLRTVPIFPQTVELIKAANNTAKNYYSLTGSNLLEADFFSAHDPSAELIADFIEDADGLVPGLFASRFDMAAPEALEASAGAGVGATFEARSGVDIPPTVEPWFKLGMDHAYTFGLWHHRLRQGNATPAISGLYSSLAFGSSQTFSSVEVTLVGTGSHWPTLPHLYSYTQQLRLLREMILFESLEHSANLTGNLSCGFGVPRAWLASEAGVQLRDAPTILGTTSVSLRLEGRSLHADVTVDSHFQALHTVVVSLRAVPLEWGAPSRAAVKVNGAPAAKPRNGCVELPGRLFAQGKAVRVVAAFP
jgi:hypothetical protein